MFQFLIGTLKTERTITNLSWRDARFNSS